MLRKLPNYLVSRWSYIVDKSIGEEREGQGREALSPTEVNTDNTREAKYPPYEEFSRFLKTEARIACNPITYLQATKEEDSKGNRDNWKPNTKFPKNKDSKDSGFRSFATGADESKEGREKTERRTRLKG